MSMSGEPAVTPSVEEKPKQVSGFFDYPWKRLMLSVLFLALMWLSLWALVFVAIAQFVLRIFDADVSDDLRSFGARLGTYMAEAAAYVVFAREDAPFPFARFPAARAA